MTDLTQPADGLPRGCLIVNAITERTADSATRDLALRQIGHVEETLRQALEGARDAGEIPPTASPGQLARFLVVMLQGLHVYGIPSRSRTAEGMDATRARKPLPSAVTVTMTLRSSAGSRSRRTYPRGGIWSHLDQIGRPSSKLKRPSQRDTSDIDQLPLFRPVVPPEGRLTVGKPHECSSSVVGHDIKRRRRRELRRDPAPVDRKSDAVDEAGIITGEEDDRRGKFLGLSYATCWC